MEFELFEQFLDEATVQDEKVLLNTKWTRPKEVETWLKANGFKKIGGGAFAGAWLKGGAKRIIKLSRKADPCFLNFAKWAVTKTNNPHLPDIPWIATFTITDGPNLGSRFFIAPIEKLQPFKKDQMKLIKDPVILGSLLVNKELWAEERKAVFRRLRLELDLPETQADALPKIKRFLNQNKNHRWLKTLDQIRAVAGPDCIDDLHTSNMMWRPSNKKLVITDPLA
jgi:hypothetical protein